MERKVITIRRRTGNGLTRCDLCCILTWDCMTYDVFKYDADGTEHFLQTICSNDLDNVRAYWLWRGYIVKERTIDG